MNLKPLEKYADFETTLWITPNSFKITQKAE